MISQHWFYVVASGAKPLPEPTMTKISDTHHQATMSWLDCLTSTIAFALWQLNICNINVLKTKTKTWENKQGKVKKKKK